MRALTIGLLVCLVQPLSAADKWTSVQTRNFLLVGDASEKQIREVADNLEEFREAVSRILPGVVRDSSTSTTVVVFRNDSSYRPFKPLYNGKPGNVAGYFQGGPDVNYITLTAGGETPRVIYHEYLHLLTRDTLDNPPPWFSEGLAEYYSTFLVFGKDNKVRIGQAIGEHVELLRSRSFLPLEVLFAVERGSPYYNEVGKQGTFYAQSWALVHYLLSGEGGVTRNQLGSFMNLLAQGRPAMESFEDAFQTNAKKFQGALESYITRRVAWSAMEITLADRLTSDSKGQARPLSEAEAQFYMGDLMLHGNRLDEAEIYLKKAISLDARIVAPQAAMGMLRMRQDKRDEALDYLKSGAESDSGNYLVHYYYAQLLSRPDRDTATGPSDEQLTVIRNELKKTIALAPDFVPAVDMLGYVNLLRNKDLDEGIALLRNTLKVQPANESLIMRLAELLARSDQWDEARPLLQRLATSLDAQPSLKEHALDLLRTSSFRESRPPGLVYETREPPVAGDTGNSDPPRIQRREGEEPPAPEPPELADGEVIIGLLTMMDCSSGLTLTIDTGAGVVKLHTGDPATLAFISYTDAIKDSVGCGPLPAPGRPVKINYRPAPAQGILGVPLVVAFTD